MRGSDRVALATARPRDRPCNRAAVPPCTSDNCLQIVQSTVWLCTRSVLRVCALCLLTSSVSSLAPSSSRRRRRRRRSEHARTRKEASPL